MAETPNTTPTSTTTPDKKKSFGQELKEATLSGVYSGLGIKKYDPNKPIKEQLKDTAEEKLYSALGLKKYTSNKKEEVSDASKIASPKENAKNISKLDRKVDNLVIHTKKNYIEILQLKKRIAAIEDKIDAIKIDPQFITEDKKANKGVARKTPDNSLQLSDLALLEGVKKLAPSLARLLLNPLTLSAAGFATLAYYAGKARREDPEGAAEFDRKLKTGGARSKTIQGPEAEVREFGPVREPELEKITPEERTQFLSLPPEVRRKYQNNPVAWKKDGKKTNVAPAPQQPASQDRGVSRPASTSDLNRAENLDFSSSTIAKNIWFWMDAGGKDKNLFNDYLKLDSDKRGKVNNYYLTLRDVSLGSDKAFDLLRKYIDTLEDLAELKPQAETVARQSAPPPVVSGGSQAGGSAPQASPPSPVTPRQSASGAYDMMGNFTGMGEAMPSSPATRSGPPSSAAGSTRRSERGTPTPTGPSTAGSTPMPSSPGLGGLSAQYESGRRGSNAVGWDSTGGTSYGKYQIASRTGTMRNFLSFLKENNPEAYERLSAAGSPDAGKNGAFAQEWKKLVSEGKMGDSEHQFIKKTHYDKGLSGIKDRGLMDMIGKSKALQEVMWSTSVQHGPGGASKIFNKMYREGMSEEDFIRSVYAERGTKFGSSTPQVQQSVMRRFQDEQKKALALVGTPAEQPSQQQAQGQAPQPAATPVSPGPQQTTPPAPATPVTPPGPAAPATPPGPATQITPPQSAREAGSRTATALSTFRDRQTGAANLSELTSVGASVAGISSITAGGPRGQGSLRGLCGKGTRGVTGALLNDSYFAKGLGGNAESLSRGNRYLQKSGLYDEPMALGKDQMSKKYLDSLPIGTVISSTGGGKGYGHVQVKGPNGTWISDGVQTKVLTNNYGNFVAHLPNEKGLQRLNPNLVNGDPATFAYMQQRNMNPPVPTPEQIAQGVPGPGPKPTPEQVQQNQTQIAQAALQQSAPGVTTSAEDKGKILANLRAGLPDSASPQVKAARESLLQAESTLRMMDPSNKMLPENQPGGAPPGDAKKVETESATPGFEGESGKLLQSTLGDVKAAEAVRAATDTGSSAAMGVGEGGENLNVTPDSELKIQRQYQAQRDSADENLGYTGEAGKAFEDATKVNASTATQGPLTEDSFKQLMGGFEKDYREKEEAKLAEADRQATIGSSTTFGSMIPDQSASAERIQSEVGKANLEAAQQGEIRQREKEVEEARDRATQLLTPQTADRPLPSTGNDPESRAASPGNNGYGSKKESGDMPSICTI